MFKIKVKLATSFSGIGAIEQALKRMEIPYEIIFACDNGDITLDVDVDKELSHIRSLPTIEMKNSYEKDLYRKQTRRTNFVEKTYKNNYNIKPSRFFYDVRLLDGEAFRDTVDLYVGGSPCQSFSAIGERLGLDDTRGTLFYDYARLIREVNPKIFIYENVYGVLTHDKGKTWKVMKDVFHDLGYTIYDGVLDAKDFGIPQSRRRLFVVGFRNDISHSDFEFPIPIKLEYTLQDFLIDNCAEGNFCSQKGKITINSKPGVIDQRYFLSEKLKKYVLSPGTKNFYHPDVKIDLPVARALLATQGNSHRASVNNYVTTNNKIRALSPREALRLMGFPDDFNITVSNAQSYKQSGNSIVVDVLIHLLNSIAKSLSL